MGNHRVTTYHFATCHVLTIRMKLLTTLCLATVRGRGNESGLFLLQIIQQACINGHGELCRLLLRLGQGRRLVSYMVGLRKSKNGQAHCGGTLIAPRWVLTTFNCATQNRGTKGRSILFNNQYASIGSTQFSSAVGGERIQVYEYFGHPDYNTKTHENEYGLLMLDHWLWRPMACTTLNRTYPAPSMAGKRSLTPTRLLGRGC